MKQTTKALILAGGFATRLRPMSCTRPKILFPILNKPLLQWTFERLAKHNVCEVIMAVNYQTEVAIKQHRIPRSGIHLTFSRDPLRKPLGSGGPIKKAEKQIGHEASFLVLNGDIFADMDYAKIIDLHEESHATATIALHQVKDPSRYGVAQLAENNRIERFIEKPPKGTAPSNLINAGVYVLNPSIFKRIPQGRAVSIEREIFTKLAQEGQLYGYVHNNAWMDIGKPEDYLELHRSLLNSANPESGVPEGKRSITKHALSDKGVTVGDKSVIGPYAVLGRNVTVGKNTKIRNSVILRETEISDSTSIDGAIIGEGVFIGKNVQISSGCIIGDHARIEDNTHLRKRVWICPAQEISGDVSTPECIV